MSAAALAASSSARAPVAATRPRASSSASSSSSSSSVARRDRGVSRVVARAADAKGDQPSMATASASTGAPTVYALDFDGVVCDSEPESSVSGWKHARALWPEIFVDDSEATTRRVLDGLKRTRPVVETGFENTLLARCVYEEIPGYSVDEILASWGALMPPLMERWNLGAFYTNVFTCISPIARFQQLTAFPYN